jgi:hypothetical protein
VLVERVVSAPSRPRPAAAIVNATYPSRPANRNDSRRSSSRNAIEPPTRAPIAVNSSSVMAQAHCSRTWRSREDARAAAAVQITQISGDADGLPEREAEPRVSSGTMRIPAARVEQGTEAPADGPSDEHQQPDDHVRLECVGVRKRLTAAQSSRVGGAGARRKERIVTGALECDACSRWWPAHVPVLASRLDLRPLDR